MYWITIGLNNRFVSYIFTLSTFSSSALEWGGIATWLNTSRNKQILPLYSNNQSNNTGVRNIQEKFCLIFPDRQHGALCPARPEHREIFILITSTTSRKGCLIFYIIYSLFSYRFCRFVQVPRKTWLWLYCSLRVLNKCGSNLLPVFFADIIYNSLMRPSQ